MGQREREGQRERQTKRQTYECAFNYYRHRRNEAERGDRNGNALLPHFSAPKPKWSNNAHARTHAHTLAISHTHTRIQLKRKHNKKWRAYKIFRAFLFRIKIRTHTHKHTHSLCSVWLRSHACLGALFAANSLARCALSLAVSLFRNSNKILSSNEFCCRLQRHEKVTTATNTHREQAHTHINTHTRLLL